MALVVGTNCYGPRSEADAYFDDSLRKEVWKAFAGGDKDKALVESTRLLERQPWDGSKESDAQALQYPRVNMTGYQGEPLTATQSFLILKEAMFEYAIALLGDNDLVSQTDNASSGIKKIEASSAKITYFKRKAGSKYPTTVLSIIKPFIDSSYSSGDSGMVASGNTDCSSFQSPNNLINGYK